MNITTPLNFISWHSQDRRCIRNLWCWRWNSCKSDPWMCRFVQEVLITKDLITYEIDSSKKPISMHEAVEGTGTSPFQVVKLVRKRSWQTEQVVSAAAFSLIRLLKTCARADLVGNGIAWAKQESNKSWRMNGRQAQNQNSSLRTLRTTSSQFQPKPLERKA